MLDHYKQRLLQIWHTANPSKEVIMKEFSDIRRQQFLYPELYEAARDDLEGGLKAYTEIYLPQISEHDKLDLFHVAKLSGLVNDALDRLSLEYTTGKPIAEVKALYPAAVAAFEAWVQAKRNWQFHEFPEDIGKVEPTPIELIAEFHASWRGIAQSQLKGVVNATRNCYGRCFIQLYE